MIKCYTVSSKKIDYEPTRVAFYEIPSQNKQKLIVEQRLLRNTNESKIWDWSLYREANTDILCSKLWYIVPQFPQIIWKESMCSDLVNSSILIKILSFVIHSWSYFRLLQHLWMVWCRSQAWKIITGTGQNLAEKVK